MNPVQRFLAFSGLVLFVFFAFPEGAPAGSMTAASPPVPELKPRRIVSINLCTDELLLRLADSGRIQAVTRYEKTPEAEAVMKRSPQIQTIKGNIEEVLAFHPDLVLAGRFSRRETVAFLKRFEIPIQMLDLPQDFEGIYQNVEKLAGWIGEPARARVWISEMKKRLASGKASPQSLRAIFYERGGAVPGNQTFEHAILRAAGLRDLAAERGIQGYGRVSFEDLIMEKPDVLIFSSEQTKPRSAGSEILDHPAIRKGLSQVKTVILPTSLLNCGTPASVEAVEQLRGTASRS